jgi:hypothetical protein
MVDNRRRKPTRPLPSRRAKKLQECAKPLQGLSPIAQWGHLQLLFAYDLHELCEDLMRAADGAPLEGRARRVYGENIEAAGPYLRERLIDLVYDIYKLIEHYTELRHAIIRTQVDVKSLAMAAGVDFIVGNKPRKGDLDKAYGEAARKYKWSRAKVAIPISATAKKAADAASHRAHRPSQSWRTATSSARPS